MQGVIKKVKKLIKKQMKFIIKKKTSPWKDESSIYLCKKRTDFSQTVLLQIEAMLEGNMQLQIEQ